MPKANRSRFPGVTWDRRHGKWMVQIRLGPRNVRLGYLDDFDDARRVYLGAKVLLRYHQVNELEASKQLVADHADCPQPLSSPSLPARSDHLRRLALFPVSV